MTFVASPCLISMWGTSEHIPSHQSSALVNKRSTLLESKFHRYLNAPPIGNCDTLSRVHASNCLLMKHKLYSLRCRQVPLGPKIVEPYSLWSVASRLLSRDHCTVYPWSWKESRIAIDSLGWKPFGCIAFNNSTFLPKASATMFARLGLSAQASNEEVVGWAIKRWSCPSSKALFGYPILF